MPSLPHWHFREMARGEINVDPVHDEFFKAQDLADALVREAIQNSLDARRGHSTVRVRIRLAHGDHALPPEVAQTYLRGLEPHLTLPQFEAMPFLIVEDSGTRGLIGDPGEDPEIDDTRGERNDFYYFWRNVGRTGKGELDRGRWGLGKAVFSVSSRMHTLFGLTRRADDSRLLLLGQAVLKVHIVEGRRFAPYGFFANVGRDHFPHAIDDHDAIARFSEDFGLQRDEPGLSIVIPFYREDDLRLESIIASVIRQYFYPITRGDLAVTVEENGRTETITGRTIEREAADPSLGKLCALARWSIALPDEEWIEIPEPDGAPKWGDGAAARPDSSPSRSLGVGMTERFERGDKLAFRVNVSIKRKRSRTPSFFRVVLERDETLSRGDHHFIRRGITIPEVRSPREKPVRGMVIADDEPIATFLGDAENPAHSDWSERNDRVRALYEHGASTLRYVKNSIAQLALMLSAPPAGRSQNLLAEIFSVTLPSGDAMLGGAGRDPGAQGEMERAPIAAQPRQPSLRILRIHGGFTIQGLDTNGNAERFTAQVAYRTRSGDPFRKYSPLDFSIGRGRVAVRADKADVLIARENRVDFAPRDPAFELTVTGFDTRRDLVVRVSRNEGDAPEAELH
ncbi:MAG TPA: hypothetical protein VM779_01050 [Thermoanaerobaculia bacterium]|nr:hypothetical protein [Thermoanaerobaculia bacterium]